LVRSVLGNREGEKAALQNFSGKCIADQWSSSTLVHSAASNFSSSPKSQGETDGILQVYHEIGCNIARPFFLGIDLFEQIPKSPLVDCHIHGTIINLLWEEQWKVQGNPAFKRNHNRGTSSPRHGPASTSAKQQRSVESTTISWAGNLSSYLFRALNGTYRKFKIRL
jgi:hypothetical protein